MQKISKEVGKTMIEVRILRENRQLAVEGLLKRGLKSADQTIQKILDLDDQRKQLQTQMDELLRRVNETSDEIGALYKQGRGAEAGEAKKMVGEWKAEIAGFQTTMNETQSLLETTLLSLPNIPHASVPAGQNEADNEIIEVHDDYMVALPEGSKPHWELMEEYDLVDLALGAKITGSGFPVYKGQGARFQRALIQFFLDEAVAAGCLEIIPPFVVNADSARGTGQLPDKDGQMYYTERDDLYLIPTSEVPLTNMFRGDILDAADLPRRLTAYSPCFRREAGSYGADVKGLNRLHQFDKVEMVVISLPENSYDVLDWMVNHTKTLLQKLELPFRILRLCGGDLGFTSALTYDFEVFSVAQKRWLEVSSVSNFETYQSNRLKLRYRNIEGRTQLLHTLNGSVLALPRIVAALLEINQKEDRIDIPEVIKPYTGFECIEKVD